MARYCRSRLLRIEQPLVHHNNRGTQLLPDVSIIITNYNYGKFIKRAIQSADNSAVYAKERGISTSILVVDDYSSDDSRTVIGTSIQTIKTPISTILLPSNCGVSAARNIGIENSKARYVAFLDADNTLAERAIHDLYSVIENTNAAAIYGQIQTIHFVTGELGAKFSFKPYDLSRLLERGNYIDTMALYRTRTLLQIGGFSSSLQLISPGYEDYELWVTLGEHGYSVLNINKIIGEYLIKEDSLITTSYHDKRIVELLLNIRYRYPRLRKFIFR